MRNSNESRLAELREALQARPRVSLANLPTPLEPCPGLTRELGGPQIWVKRDDLTGLATGGNKTRMFEYVLGQAIEDGVDTVVGGAAVQSNYCRQLAAACAKLGLDCHLLLRKVRAERDDEIQGGLLLDLLVGAKVETIEGVSWAEHGERIRKRAQELEARGKRVYIGRVGDESRLGRYAVAYTQAFVELIEQAEEAQLTIDEVWMSSSDATQAGLAIAAKHCESPVRLVGLPSLPQPIAPGWTFAECISSFGNECAEILGLPTRLEPDDITSIVDYVGPGYGVLTDAARTAMQLAGRCDALLLDPVYTSKAMAGLIDHVRRGLVAPDHTIVFLHTGGLPALFAYADSLGLEALL
ncbi:MAG: pyridoxal-phosphate dependent enzyme [Gemmatimonadota bacterium]|nr:MAG: pyridoxal-phosphate dependent enzyme [Gemmatimonadota bacterium]